MSWLEVARSAAWLLLVWALIIADADVAPAGVPLPVWEVAS